MTSYTPIWLFKSHIDFAALVGLVSKNTEYDITFVLSEAQATVDKYFKANAETCIKLILAPTRTTGGITSFTLKYVTYKKEQSGVYSTKDIPIATINSTGQLSFNKDTQNYNYIKFIGLTQDELNQKQDALNHIYLMDFLKICAANVKIGILKIDGVEKYPQVSCMLVDPTNLKIIKPLTKNELITLVANDTDIKKLNEILTEIIKETTPEAIPKHSDTDSDINIYNNGDGFHFIKNSKENLKELCDMHQRESTVGTVSNTIFINDALLNQKLMSDKYKPKFTWDASILANTLPNNNSQKISLAPGIKYEVVSK